jgi:hypothetical protein
MSLGNLVNDEVTEAPAEAPIELLTQGARLRLEIPCSGLAEYLRAIPAEKRIIAMTHVIEVGLTEVARRQRLHR